MKPFCENLSEIRKRLNLNGRGFAKACGVSSTYITYLEREERQPSEEFIERVVKLAEGNGLIVKKEYQETIKNLSIA